MYLYLGGGTWGHLHEGGGVMIAHPRRPTSACDGRQIGWEIRVADVLHRGVLPVNPGDCPWFREDGQHHACCTGEGEAFCDAMVCLTPAMVICAYGCALDASHGKARD
jgi:hypothetical protein